MAFLADPLADAMPLILGNHDGFAGERTWTRLAGDQAAYKLLAASYLRAGRSPFNFCGEGIGMANGAGLTGDAALRTPSSWTADAAHAGFSTVAPFRALSGNSTTRNVALVRESGAECAAVFINYSTAAQLASADTCSDGLAFAALFGATGSVNSDAMGRIFVTVPVRSTLVCHAP